MAHISEELQSASFWGTLISLVIVVGLFGYGGYQYVLLHQKQVLFATEINALKKQLAQAEAEKASLQGELMVAQDKYTSLGSVLGTISTTVGTLQKLSQTDKELLQKYSRIYFLNEHYIPKSLTTIDSHYVIDQKTDIQIHTDVWPKLKALLDEAETKNIPLKIESGYRSFNTQKALKTRYQVTYGKGANTFSADQGYSEHQLGTAVDFSTPTIGSALTGFEKTKTFIWLNDNAYQFGFILSYPAGNKYYIFEPWHWRFVGVALATKLHAEGKNFHDTDQRAIDTYLVNIFD